MAFSTKFIAGTRDYTTFSHRVPAPFLRRSITLDASPEKAVLTLCGLGFYDLFVNGERITKGILAPYISNPDDVLYYDIYDIAKYLHEGENVLGFILGNGMLNCPGGEIWDFEKARYRSAPKLAMSLDIDGDIIEADESFRTAPSPIMLDDIRIGEFYDARCEIDGWAKPGFDDSNWRQALPAETPRGVCRICEADPIAPREEIKPVSVTRGAVNMDYAIRPNLPNVPFDGVEGDTEGWLYDFGVNAAGLCRLKIKGTPGQKIVMQFGEEIGADGKLDLRGMSFLPHALNHRDIYICRGGEEEIYLPRFTYHGFRYCLVLGMTDAQATPDALTYIVYSSALNVNAQFSCSDEVVNRLWKAGIVSDLANFFYFPTDCPHREKNGWTGDAALSAEQMLVALSPERSYHEWLFNLRRAQNDAG
ncbi:MAG: family 78 glycoside hydrolase catalytic domain, partial [Eubacteriales bacterium]